VPEAEADALVVWPTSSGDDDRQDDQADDGDNLIKSTHCTHERAAAHFQGAEPELDLAVDLGSGEIDSPLSQFQSPITIACRRRHTTTRSINPTQRALLQIPVVQVESTCPAGVQYEMRTAAAEISAGRTMM
jgi:hypothetical protein